MVVILRENYNEEQRDNLVNWLESLGITVHSSLGEHNTATHRESTSTLSRLSIS